MPSKERPAGKAKPKAEPTRTERFTRVMADLKKAKEEAKKQIVSLRKQARSEKQRHERIFRKASLLGASELTEIAGLRNMTMEDLARHAAEMSVADRKQTWWNPIPEDDDDERAAAEPCVPEPDPFPDQRDDHRDGHGHGGGVPVPAA